MSAYTPSGFFVLRAPRLALAPVGELRARLADPDVQDALVSASPLLAKAVVEGRRDLGTELSLTRYLARMSGRATPRGLLAGVSTGRLGGSAVLRLAEGRPVSRLNAPAVRRIAAGLEADPHLRESIRFRPNPWLYSSEPGRIRYVESKNGGHALVAADASDELSATLARAREGATIGELAEALAEDGADPGDARAFVEEVVAAGALVSELVLPACGPDPEQHLCERLRAMAPGSSQLRDVERIRAVLAAADASAPGARAATLGAAAAAAGRLGLEGRLEPHVQTDLVRAAPGLSLPSEVANRLLDALEGLRRLVRADEPAELAAFRDAFSRRYGEARVPLPEALDPDYGVGFGPEAPVAGAEPSGTPWGPTEQLRLRLVTEAAARGAIEVDVSSALASAAERSAAPLPDAFAILATLAADDEDAVDRGDYEARLIGAVGPSGVRLFGRFCHHDAHLRAHAEQHLRAEEALHPDAVFAEISHLPGAGAGDVISRPALRAREIALLAGPSSEVDRIELRDLDVGLEAGEIVLRDAGGRRVIPRLSNAHDMFADGLGLYRFLAQLQFQGVAPGLSWSWGPLEGAPFLPRVRLGRVVLAPARWRIAPDELTTLRAGGHDERVAAVSAWRARAGCPRLVAVPAHESALPLDLDDPMSVEILLREQRPDGSAAVEERWPGPDRSPVTGPGGRFAHELLIPFVSTRAPTRDRVLPRTAVSGRRTRPPGTDWLFVKLYTSPARADALVVDELAPLARRALAAGTAASWHFLRFADPDFHLRLRLSGDPDALREELMPAVLEAGARLMESGRVRRVALDTYEREVERYGGQDGIELAEAAFHADSEAVAAVLAALPRGEHAVTERWQLAAAGAWSLVLALGLGEDEAARLAAGLRDEFGGEQRLDGNGVRRLARGLRTARPPIEQLIEHPPAAFRERDARLGRLAARLGQLHADGALSRTPPQIAGALAHMHCNRLLRESARRHELQIYDALARIAAGRIARRRQAALR